MTGSKNRITIIGGGPGGYVAAICGAQLGARVTLIEKDTLGGTCLNRGCIPTKSLLQSAGIFKQIEAADTFGITVEKIALDFSKVCKRKQQVVRQLLNGVNFLMKKNGINVIKGTGTIIEPGRVKVAGNENITIETDQIIIATGSKPLSIPIKGANQKGVINSDGALAMERLPESMIIIGGGVIGLEFAQIFHRFKTRVTVIEMAPQVLPSEDAEIARMLEKILRKEGIDIYTGAEVKSIETDKQGYKTVFFNVGDKEKKLAAGKVLIAAGRRPCIENIGLKKLGVSLKNGAIIVNKRMETDIKNIYAIGDVTGDPMLAHKAMAEGRCAVQNAIGIDSEIDYKTVPRCIYTSPEIASVGLTEKAALEKYGDIKIGKFPFRGNGKALIMDKTEGMVKFIIESKYDEVLGAEIIGPCATEMIAEAVLGMHLEATINDFASAVHAHPTLSEAIMEAALGADGKSLHI